MPELAYHGIKFPDRAEYLEEFEGYKVFLDHWEPLAVELRGMYEGLALRRDTRALAIYGAQGTGKTLFAQKLVSDFRATKQRLPGAIVYDPNNLWHRATGGPTRDPAVIAAATANADVHLIENQRDWVSKTGVWLEGRRDRRSIVIADNAERAYFRQGLIELSDAEYLRIGESPEAMRMIAQNFVSKCRAELRGSLFVLLSNDTDFLSSMSEAVGRQHEGLFRVERLPIPGGTDKETVVRVNTNRLNPISYWYCLDKAGPEEKLAVKSALAGASTFPDSFKAVDNAIRTATPTRIGRPARKNVITLVVLTDQASVPSDFLQDLGTPDRTELSHKWVLIRTFSSGWATGLLEDPRQASLLESEWLLRVAVLGDPFVASLLSRGKNLTAAKSLVEATQTYHGPGTLATTREEHETALKKVIDVWPTTGAASTSAFWAKGQTRSNDYEGVLRTILPGYDLVSAGFMNYRPDFVAAPFRPCSILSAISDEQRAINDAIRREAHVLEFTAQKVATKDSIQAYLREKLQNYVLLTQEQ
ncbi:MAG TPA: hypothetical protein VGR37_13170 [Longimicrobiaceae bacterium]|nr:hypothetical protein [Longimicrobiaceae bacterium]